MTKTHNVTSSGAQQLGFTQGGVARGSVGAHAMASGHGHVPTAVSGLQSVGTGHPSAHAQAQVAAGAHQLGFTSGGVAAGTPAAEMMAAGRGGNVPQAVSAMQQMGAQGGQRK